MNFEKYINLPFLYKGRSLKGVDCYGLLWLVLKEEKDVILQDYEYSAIWVKNEDYIINGMKNLKDFIQIKFPENPFDIILFYSTPEQIIVSHIGIFIGDNRFLHIKEEGRSMIERLNNHWINRIYKVLRYQKVDENG